jgi:hypothetical protein
MQSTCLRVAAVLLAAVGVATVGASAMAVQATASGFRLVPYLSLPTRSDLLNPNGTVNKTSPFLAGVGGTNAYTGVGTLYIKSDNSGAGAFLCTGSLISPTVVITAAHCVANPEIGHLKELVFSVPNGRPLYGVSPAPNPGPIEEAVGGAFATLPSWDINTLSNDMALVKLDKPITGTQIYSIYRGSPLHQKFTLVGTGTSGWGAVGADSQTGYKDGLFDLRKRVGENVFDLYAKPFFEAVLSHFGIDQVPTGPADGMLLYDFGTGRHDVFAQLCNFADPALSSLCVKRPEPTDEVSAAPGDSGGPSFINGQIAGITSWGETGAILSFDGRYIYCGSPNNIDPSYNVDNGSCTDSSFGEFNGVTNVSAYQGFVDAGLAGDVRFTRVPEPVSLALFLSGLAGLCWWRRRNYAGSGSKAG